MPEGWALQYSSMNKSVIAAECNCKTCGLSAIYARQIALEDCVVSVQPNSSQGRVFKLVGRNCYLLCFSVRSIEKVHPEAEFLEI